MAKTITKADDKPKSTPLNTYFSQTLTFAIMKYEKDNGFSCPQDVIRLAVIAFLKSQGYIKES